MIGVSRRKMLLAGVVTAGAVMAGTTPVLSTAAPQKPTAIAYRDLWRRLWEDHITWTRVVIIMILDGRPPAKTNAYVVRLLQNP